MDKPLEEIFPVSRETEESLSILVEVLQEWQKKTNLIAPSTLDQIWERHIRDSLQVLSISPNTKHWLDLGSGGGFPGLVIAAAMAKIPDSTVTLVEAIAKKTSFLRHANRKMDANAKVINSRIENVGEIKPFPQIVTARALASLPELLSLASPWLLNGAAALFHKGREYERELALCHGIWEFDLVVHQSQIEDDSVILEISNLKISDT